MAEITSGENLTVMVLTEVEVNQLARALSEWLHDHTGRDDDDSGLYEVMEAIGVMDR